MGTQVVKAIRGHLATPAPLLATLVLGLAMAIALFCAVQGRSAGY